MLSSKRLSQFVRLVATLLIFFSLFYIGISSTLASNPDNGYITFDGNDDYIDLDGFEHSAEAVTIETWFNTSDFTNPECATSTAWVCYLYAKYTETNQAGTLLRTHTTSSGLSRVQAFLRIDGTLRSVISTTDLEENTWNHVAMTYDSNGDKKIKIYINGVLEKESPVYDGVVDPGGATRSLLGAWPSGLGASSNRNLEGSMDDFRVWNIERTAQEIADNKDVELMGSESGLMLYYRLNDGYGQAVSDSSTTAHDGALGDSALPAVNDPIWVGGLDQPAPLCEQTGCVTFDGNDDYIDLASFEHSSDAITVEAWFKTTDFTNPECATSTVWVCYLYTKSNEAGQAGTLLRTHTTSSGLSRIQAFLRIDGTLRSAISATDLEENTWNHVAMTYDSNGDKKIRIYINGNLEKESPVYGGVVDTGGVARSLLGAWPSGSGTGSSRNLEGSIDDVRIWNIERTAQEIADNKDVELMGSESGLMLYYRLNDGYGQVASDSGTTAHDGTLGGTNLPDGDDPIWVGGVLLSAPTQNYLNFDGQDDYVNLGPIDISGSALTIETWFNGENFNNCPSGDCRLISKASSTSSSDHYWMLSTLNNGGEDLLRFRLNTTIGGTETLIASTGSLNESTWYHVAATYDGEFMRLYLDGVEVASTAKTGGVSTNVGVDAWIGGNPNGPTDRPWDGSIDDVRIWDIARSAAQILADKDIELSGTEAGLVHYYKFETSGQDVFDYGPGNNDTILGSTSDIDINDPSIVNQVPDTTPPTWTTAGTTANLIVSSVTGASISLTWDAADDDTGIGEYVVLESGVEVGRTSTLSFTDVGLTPSTSYSYTIFAVDLAGNQSIISTPAVTGTTSSTAVTCNYTGNPNDPGDDLNPTSGTYYRAQVSTLDPGAVNSVVDGQPFPTPLTTGICGVGVEESDLTDNTTCTITTDNIVLDMQKFDCNVVIEADNVTITRSLITSSAQYAFRFKSGSNLIVRDTRIRGTGGSAKAVLIGSSGGATFERTHITGSADNFHTGGSSNVTIRDSYMTGTVKTTGTHNDVVQIRGGHNWIIEGNSFIGPWQTSTSTILLQAKAGDISNVSITDNYLSGAKLYTTEVAPYNMTSVTVTQNVFEEISCFGSCAQNSSGGGAVWTDNFYTDGGQL